MKVGDRVLEPTKWGAKVGDLVGRRSVPRFLGVVVDIDETSAKVFYLTARQPRWVSFDLLEVLNESR